MKRSFLGLISILIIAIAMLLGTVSVFGEGYLKIECEDYDDANPDVNPHDAGQAIKSETTTGTNVGDIGNVGGTFEEGWLLFKNVNFGDKGADKVTLQYCNNSQRCTEDANVELRIGSLTGKVIAQFDIPPTGPDWLTYDTVTANLVEVVKGKNDLYLIMLGTTEPSHKYIANFDYLEFSEAKESGTDTQSAENTTPAATTPETLTTAPTETAAPTPTKSPDNTSTANNNNELSGDVNNADPLVIIIAAVVVIAVGIGTLFIIKNSKK